MQWREPELEPAVDGQQSTVNSQQSTLPPTSLLTSLLTSHNWSPGYLFPIQYAHQQSRSSTCPSPRPSSLALPILQFESTSVLALSLLIVLPNRRIADWHRDRRRRKRSPTSLWVPVAPVVPLSTHAPTRSPTPLTVLITRALPKEDSAVRRATCSINPRSF